MNKEQKDNSFKEIIELFRKNNIEPKKVQLIYPKPGCESNMVLIEGRKNGKCGLKVLEPVFVHEENGEYRENIKKMFTTKEK